MHVSLEQISPGAPAEANSLVPIAGYSGSAAAQACEDSTAYTLAWAGRTHLPEAQSGLVFRIEMPHGAEMLNTRGVSFCNDFENTKNNTTRILVVKRVFYCSSRVFIHGPPYLAPRHGARLFGLTFRSDSTN